MDPACLSPWRPQETVRTASGAATCASRLTCSAAAGARELVGADPRGGRGLAAAGEGEAAEQAAEGAEGDAGDAEADGEVVVGVVGGGCGGGGGGGGGRCGGVGGGGELEGGGGVLGLGAAGSLGVDPAHHAAVGAGLQRLEGQRVGAGRQRTAADAELLKLTGMHGAGRGAGGPGDLGH